ncbi:MAG: hypothetical protein H6832_06055 [Planctomycetes bacterium]|nr:hypothetical protein [Planctomycetota bacterium]MCB9917949.1 hypothetical protein [Planctomycetota bacterium]
MIVGGGEWRTDDSAALQSEASIWALDARKKGSAWTKLERSLPASVAFGVSIALEKGALWVGGSASSASSGDASPDGQPRADRRTFFVGTNDDPGAWSAGPSLPEGRAFACGARLGTRVYVACGRNETGLVTQSLFVLDLADPERRWAAGASLPGVARANAIAGSRNGFFYVVGGEDASGTALKDCWRFDGSSWTQIASLPVGRSAAPSPLLTVHGQLLLYGGDPDGSTGKAGASTQLDGLAPDANTWIAWPELSKHRGPDPDRRPDLGSMPPLYAPVVTLDRFQVIVGGEIDGGAVTSKVALFVAGDEDSSRALLMFGVLLVLAVLPTILALVYAFRVHARRSARTNP